MAVNGPVTDYTYAMAQSVFCLAAPGKEAYRMVGPHAAIYASYMAASQSGIDASYMAAEILPYDKFTVRIAEMEIPRMHIILAGISNATIANMQKELACVYP
eukprot:gene21044-25253_t